MEAMKKTRKKFTPLPVLIVLAAVLFLLILFLDRPMGEPEIAVPMETEATVDPYADAHTPMDRLQVYAGLHDLTLEDWPEDMLELLRKNPDAEEYVRNYPAMKDHYQEADLSDLVGTGEVPKLYQWDERWGYSLYGGKPMGITACGPTCLSMACLYFLEDPMYTPRYVADFSQENDYYTDGYGSTWTLISQGGVALGLDVIPIPPNMERVRANLEVGNLVIFCMGPGDFTTTGHFVLVTGLHDGMAIIHDPNSPTNSQKLWDLDQLKPQIENLWVLRLPLSEEAE